MFSIRCMRMKIKQATPYEFHLRKQSRFHSGVKFLFKKNLLITNSITSGICMALGDLAQQELEFQTKVISYRYDWGRIVRMFLVGTAMGPMHHYYYIYLDKVLPKANIKTVGVKIICDQLMASPLTILCFFFGLGFLERQSFTDTASEIKKKFLYVYMGDCMYWPPVQFVNFYFLPTQYRVIYINIATMVFNVFLSFIKYYDQEKH